MKKTFTTGSVAVLIAISFAACTKSNNNPTPNKNSMTTFFRKDTVTPPKPHISIRDTVTPPRNFSITPMLKKDTVTPPQVNIAIRDTVTPPRGQR